MHPAPVASFTDADLLNSARKALTVEAKAVESLLPKLDRSFAAACHLCLGCTGRVVVSGMGKSGHIGGKIAAGTQIAGA